MNIPFELLLLELEFEMQVMELCVLRYGKDFVRGRMDYSARI
jgi:hypothetical protein